MSQEADLRYVNPSMSHETAKEKLADSFELNTRSNRIAGVKIIQNIIDENDGVNQEIDRSDRVSSTKEIKRIKTKRDED